MNTSSTAAGAGRRGHVVDVALDGGVADVFDGSGAGETVELRAAGAALPGRARGGARLGGVEFGELLALLAAEGPGGAALLGVLFAQFEAFEARIDVGPPRAKIHRAPHRLAVLAVVDDIDAELGLLADNVAHSRAKPWL